MSAERLVIAFAGVLIMALTMAEASAGESVVLETIVPLPPPAFEINSVRSDLDRPARALGPKYTGPVIDTHIHINPSHKDLETANPKGIVDAMDATGVEAAVIMPTPNEGRKNMGAELLDRDDEGRVKFRAALARASDGRLIRFCCGNYISYWLHIAYNEGYRQSQLDAFLSRIRRDLDSGAYAGVGEVALYHFNKNGENPVISYPPNFIPFLRVADLVADKGLWLNLHAEPMDPNDISYERQVFAAIGLMMRRRPNLKLILAHSLMTNTVNLRNVLRLYPTVVIEFKHRNKQRTRFNLEPINNLGMEFYEDWAELFEEQPQRFIVGEDMKFFRRGFDARKYDRNIGRLRLMLGSLPRRAAELIAYRNARRMFGLENSISSAESIAKPRKKRKGGRRKGGKRRRGQRNR